ncbi:type II toxin-antitoxin system death-on-curing family toxin [Leptolyngbya cf. ectocarpi LEGE 11479]|uniref:Type II toxin-antitoxin system death-on-curing family toxin n=2 Tax=Leptolyngbya ectocarpi TaxID=1202 RepID=A0A929F720_LEPEC|nr:type II toxin-antitoxin system death-on-curing family toxin [Leptolyngbya ectocarpi]MBE9067986.1 type II toxin-antitoxin system death-on-curing family toxin [Leptolyngbya cf. ectocarpi LEGE 11479]
MIEAAHYDQIQKTGGTQGILDENELESLIARPKNHLAYRQAVDIFGLAACYLWGFACTQVFADGNKRAGLSALLLFLGLNGYRLTCDREPLVLMVLSVANKKMSQDDVVIWLRENVEQWDGNEP